MGGADLIVFTGGVGENDYLVREWVCEGMEYMGILFDKEANDGVRARDIIISTPRLESQGGSRYDQRRVGDRVGYVPFAKKRSE